MSEPPPDTAARIFAWKVVAAAFLIAIFAWGVGFYGPSVFLQTLHAERGWAVSTVSAAITVHFLCSAVLVINLPQAHRRFGVKRVTQGGVLCAAVGLVAVASAREAWQLFPAALLTGAGWAATSGAAINAMIAPWFDRDRPKALSLAFNGASVGGLVFTPAWVLLIAQLGFAPAAAVVAAAMLAVLWPLAARYLGPRPTAACAPDRAGGLGRLDLLRERRFVTLSAAFALGLFAQIGLFAHLVTHLAPAFGAGFAAAAVSLAAFCAVLGRTLLGWALGERDRRLAAAVNFLVQACGTALLTFGGGSLAALLGAILFGLGVGNLISLPPLIAQKEFAPGDLATVVALVTAINQAVFAFAPAILGLLRDLQGGYVLPFALAGAIQLLAAALVIAGGRATARQPAAAPPRD